MRWLPNNLAGQMTLLIGVALLVAQLANMTLLLNEGEKRRLAQDESQAISMFVSATADYLADGELPRRGRRFTVVPKTSITEAARRPGLESRVSTALADAGVTIRAVRATRREAPPPQGDGRGGDGARRGGGRQVDGGRINVGSASGVQNSRELGLSGPPARRAGDDSNRLGPPDGRPPWGDRPGFDWPGADRAAMLRGVRQVVIAAQLPDGRWLEGRLLTPKRDPVMTARLIAATVLLYLIVLGVTIAIARWLARPLHDLTAAAEGFAGKGSDLEVKPRGPSDLRRLIVAFNAMKVRVSAMMDEKDRMLGAIGHDLRTPLASLRIRAENLENSDDRDRMIATIKEASTMLEDILVLARTGRVREEARDVDIAALLDAVVEEYVEMGRPVSLEEPAARTVGHVQPALLRRAIRNLVDNAVAYAGSARLCVSRNAGEILITVVDEGPGIAEADLVRVLQPFERGEESRNRDTGGSGLGLAIADAVIQGHGGRLTLANRPAGGLEAVLHLPA